MSQCSPVSPGAVQPFAHRLALMEFHVVESLNPPLGVAGDNAPYTLDFRFQNRIAGLDNDPPAPDRAGQHPLAGDVTDFR
ncbi:hypothetical protein Aca07nite_58790 [Actinoplanes capillaceus]|uniref:Uncharacterized protein n=1 Tax=Actinoplanes campanulatus TaxID=113559 RepID=A0ABQ3WQR7_9ACTN|nr:hypothetical protein Aca07nite_58790 [Actinoplanes capillaceus]